MAKVTFVDGIDTVRGALDSVKDGQAKRERLVCKWHYWGEKWIDEDGSKVHLVYTYPFHEGSWSKGATRNREMIKAAQRMAHNIERDPQLREEWVARYAVYRASLPEGCNQYYHFYNFVFVTIYRAMRKGTDERMKE